ncbi:MAG TPA: hypothetical protein VHY83_04895 [Solirubrobacteraceae bacterium]|jgi:hypothetical protein|nr:hypothetical protein [Solirubrobacteraceae bacterium]
MEMPSEAEIDAMTDDERQDLIRQIAREDPGDFAEFVRSKGYIHRCDGPARLAAMRIGEVRPAP